MSVIVICTILVILSIIPRVSRGHWTPFKLDAIVLNPCRYISSLNVRCYLSDFRNIIRAATKTFAPEETRTIYYQIYNNSIDMMTSSNGNVFRVTGPLCGEFTGDRWIPHTRASDAELWCFLWSASWINGWVNNREAGDLRRQCPQYDVIVMTRCPRWQRICPFHVMAIFDDNIA